MNIMVLDIGGTSIKSAVFQEGSLSRLQETPTEAHLGGEHVADRAASLIASYGDSCPLERIGISTAGQVNPETGTIIYANRNIPGYTGICLKKRMEQKFGIPTAVENDVNAAALGEAVYGAGKGEKDFVCLTYGTGIGGAIFQNGKLCYGSSCSAGEFGSLILHPEDRVEDDPFSGGYEKYASVTALVEKARKADPTLTDGRTILQRKDEPHVKALLQDWIREIVYGLVTVTHMLNPSCIILGGGVMEQPFLLELIRQELMENLMESFRHVRLKSASLGNRAGLLGAGVRASNL